ncbi:MAG TPA: hypothetical protein EYM31_02890 [Acidobacteria bacterium]|nr:hypothetical protein [Acidobacteriota bacterium]
MRNRYLVTVCTIAAMVVSVSALATAQSSTPLRTAWGDPDLGGVWNNSTLTPFQRPERLGDQEFLTEEEAANVEQEAVDRNERLLNEEAQRTEAGGNIGAYNNFWMERGTSVVSTRRTSIITDPTNGRLPSLTTDAHARMTSPEAERLAAVRGGRLPTDSYTQLDGGDRCLWYRGIPSFPTAYNNNYQIVQTPEFVAILQEHIHDVRFIMLDGRPHLTPAIRQFAGDSRGHWEGDTLVVETTNFNHHAFIRNFNGNLSEDLHVVERFTRTGEGTLDYEFTVTDPKTWTREWGGALPMTRSVGPMFEYACHEGNYGLTNMLAGSRAQEAEEQ